MKNLVVLTGILFVVGSLVQDASWADGSRRSRRGGRPATESSATIDRSTSDDSDPVIIRRDALGRFCKGRLETYESDGSHRSESSGSDRNGTYEGNDGSRGGAGYDGL
jgi:hypothetical protein